MKYPEILAIRPEPRAFAYDDHFTMLYALALGSGAEPDELDFVYERNLRALPTMAVLLGAGIEKFISDGGIDYRMLVHGEQRLTLHQPLPPTGKMMSHTRCLGVVDKGPDKGALVHIEGIVTDAASGVLFATSVISLFCRGDGGFGGPGEDMLTLQPAPGRPHDIEVALPTLPQQAALYRLLGDRNPLHIDPEMARAVGFDRPILHGLCTYGIAGRAIMRGCTGNNPAMIEHIEGRFSAPVYPGETVLTRIWRDGDAVWFECSVAERGVTVIRNGFCRLRGH